MYLAGSKEQVKENYQVSGSRLGAQVLVCKMLNAKFLQNAKYCLANLSSGGLKSE
jgi:hypothetical protein